MGHYLALGLDIRLTVISFLYSQATSFRGGLWKLILHHPHVYLLFPNSFNKIPGIKFHSLHAHPWIYHRSQWEELHDLARSGLCANILAKSSNRYIHKGKVRWYIHVYNTASQHLAPSWAYTEDLQMISLHPCSSVFSIPTYAGL